MSDDRLFASNNAIGRKWYFINLIILTIIAYIVQYIFTDHIIPNVVSDVYEIIAKGILYFAYLIFLITFFALIERRLYDVCGKRDSNGYKNTSAVLKFAIFLQILALYCEWQNPTWFVPNELVTLAAMVFDIIFFVIIFILAFLKGSISNLSYEEYRKKIKYE